jgi:hypothetical protein
LEITRELARLKLREFSKKIKSRESLDKLFTEFINDDNIPVHELTNLENLMEDELITAIENHCAMEAEIIPDQKDPGDKT